MPIRIARENQQYGSHELDHVNAWRNCGRRACHYVNQCAYMEAS